MLLALLERLSRGGAFSTQSLAAEFNISHELMEAMLADLVRSGRLQVYESCGQGSCGGCGKVSSCNSQGKMWEIVTKDGSHDISQA